MQAIDGAPRNRAALVTCLSRVYFAGWPGFFFLQLRPSLPPTPRSAGNAQRVPCPENGGSAYSAQANARPASPNVRLCLIRAVHRGRALSRTVVFRAETPDPVVPTKQNRSFRDIPSYCEAMIKQNRLYEGMKKAPPPPEDEPTSKGGCSHPASRLSCQRARISVSPASKAPSCKNVGPSQRWAGTRLALSIRKTSAP